MKRPGTLAKLTLSDFTSRFRDGIDVSRFSLDRAGLARAADGDGDGVIAGPELERAFRYLDRFDRDGSARTVDTGGSAGAAWRAFAGASRAPGALATDAKLLGARLETSVVDWKASALNAAQTEAGHFRRAAERYLDLAGGQSDTGLADLAGNTAWALSESTAINLAAVCLPAAIHAGAGMFSFDTGAAKQQLGAEVDAQLESQTRRTEDRAATLRARIQQASQRGDTAALRTLETEVRALSVAPPATSDAIYRDLLLRHAEKHGISIVGDPSLARAPSGEPLIPGFNQDRGNFYLSTSLASPLTLNGPEIARELSALDPTTFRSIALNTTARDFLIQFPDLPLPSVLSRGPEA